MVKLHRKVASALRPASQIGRVTEHFRKRNKRVDGDLEAPVSKGKTYQISKQLVEAFQKKNGSLVCKELKGVETGCPLRSCNDCIADAAELAEQILFAEK